MKLTSKHFLLNALRLAKYKKINVNLIINYHFILNGIFTHFEHCILQKTSGSDIEDCFGVMTYPASARIFLCELLNL